MQQKKCKKFIAIKNIIVYLKKQKKRTIRNII